MVKGYKYARIYDTILKVSTGTVRIPGRKSDEELAQLVQLLLGNKKHLCKTCVAICSSNRRELSGLIKEGITSDDCGFITECDGYIEKTEETSDKAKYYNYFSARISEDLDEDTYRHGYRL